jgi:hypothetical protein
MILLLEKVLAYSYAHPGIGSINGTSGIRFEYRYIIEM